jgi:hypothetical protein
MPESDEMAAYFLISIHGRDKRGIGHVVPVELAH